MSLFNRISNSYSGMRHYQTVTIQSIPRKLTNMADHDGLEYYIKFPSPGSHKSEKRLTPIINEEKPPVVVLFGWAGCLDKHLEKYSKIYEDRGLITLRYSTNAKLIFWKRHALKSLGERFVRLLHEVNFDSHPIIVHCFSNGGAFVYKSFASALAESTTPAQVKGMILDSAPGERRIAGLFKALSAIIGGNIWYNLPVTIIAAAFIIVRWQFDVFRSILFNDHFEVDPVQWLKKQDNVCPQFFIYSKVDELISSKDVEAFIDIRKDIGVDVSALCFEDSPHVKHYSYYGKEYTDGVCDFLEKCLKRKH